MDVLDLIALTFVLIRFIVLIPIMLYGIYLFQIHKDDPLISHRNPFLIYIITILTILTLSIERTFMISALIWNIIHVTVWTVYVVLGIFWWALFALFAVKVYNLYYLQQYNISITDEVWKRDINPQTADWYIKNKNKWGSAIWLCKLCLVPYIISCVGDAIFPHIFGESAAVDVFRSAIVFFPVCVAFVVVYKARELYDIWQIRNETLYQAVLSLFALMIYIIAFCIGYIPFLQQQYGYDDLYRFKWILYSLFGDIMAISFAIVPTLYPVYLIKRAQVCANQSLMSGYQSSDDMYLSLYSMNEIMFRYNAFQLFMQYLVSEFSAENALFLIELIQIKHDFQKRNDFKVKIPKAKNSEDMLVIDFNRNPINGERYSCERDRYFTYLFHQSGSIRCKISIPIEVPKSSIVTKNANNLCKQMCCLYRKYVAVNRLNLSHTIHERLDEIFAETHADPHKLNEDQCYLFNAMDDCGAAVLLLLQQSFGRFISEKTFAPILQQIKDEMSDKNNKIRIWSDVEMKKILNSTSTAIVNANLKQIN